MAAVNPWRLADFFVFSGLNCVATRIELLRAERNLLPTTEVKKCYRKLQECAAL
jgi:hypothetical protein